MAIPNLKELVPQEKTRTYTFPSGKVVLENVTKFAVSDSGTHRLETQDGKKHVIFQLDGFTLNSKLIVGLCKA